MAYGDEFRVDGVCYEDGKLDSVYVKTPEGHKVFAPLCFGRWVAVECGTFCTNCTRVFDHHFEIPHLVCKKLSRCPACGAKMEVDSGG